MKKGKKDSSVAAHTIDRPVLSSGKDRFERRGFAQRLATLLIDTADAGIVLALTGNWGSGKSTLLNFLEAAITDASPNAIVVRFAPWLLSKHDELVEKLLLELSYKLKGLSKKQNDTFDKAASRIAEYALPFTPLANLLVLGAGTAAGKALRAATTTPRQTTHELKSAVEAALSKVPHRVLVFLDDLDRLTDEEVRETFRFIKAVADFRQVTYVVAFDRDRILEAIRGPRKNREAHSRAEKFLEKIIQLEVRLPIIAGSELQDLFQDSLQELIDQELLPAQSEEDVRYQRLLLIVFAPSSNPSPRDIARIFLSFRAFLQLIDEDINWVDLLTFAYLCVREPSLTSRLREALDLFVDDPEDTPFRTSSAKSDRSVREDWISQNEVTPQCKKALSLLFPALAREGTSEDANRISRRQNFLTVLRFGLPPGFYSQEDALRFLAADGATIVDRLNSEKSNGSLRDFFEHIRVVYCSPSFKALDEKPENEITLWLAVFDFLASFSADIIQRQSHRWIEESLLRMIERRAKNTPTIRTLVRRLMATLIERSEFEFVARVLRRQFVLLQMYAMQTQDSGTPLLEKQEAEELSDDFKQRVLELTQSGKLLLQHASVLPLITMLTLGAWRKEDQQLLLSQLSDSDLLDRFVVSGWFPGHALQTGTVAALVDSESFWNLVQARHNELMHSGAEASTVARCYANALEKWM